MKKINYLIFVFLFLVFFMPKNTLAKIINVPKDYPTIQQALDNAYAGDTIKVEPGFYRGNLQFPRSGNPSNPIVLEGQTGAKKKSAVILDGSVIIKGWEKAPEFDDYGVNVYRKHLSTMTDIGYPYHMTWNNKYILRIRGDKMNSHVDKIEIDGEKKECDPQLFNDKDIGFKILAKPCGDDFWNGVEALFGHHTDYAYVRLRGGQNPDNENVTFGKPYALGKKYNLDGPGVVNIIGQSHIVVRGFTIQGGSIGVLIKDGANNNVIEDNYIMHGSPASVLIDGWGKLCHGNHICNNEITLNYMYSLNPRTYFFGHIFDQFKCISDYDRQAVYLYCAGHDNEVYGNHIFQHWDGVQDYYQDPKGKLPQECLKGVFCKRLKVYDNVIHDIADDGLEPSGDEKNAEWHDNFVYECNINIRIKEPKIGPLYIFRNCCYTPEGPMENGALPSCKEAGEFREAESNSTDIFYYAGTEAKIYIYHNSFSSYRGLYMGQKWCVGAKNTWFINNIFSNEFFWDRAKYSSNEEWEKTSQWTGKQYMNAHFHYNWCSGKDFPILLFRGFPPFIVGFIFGPMKYNWMGQPNIIELGKRIWLQENPNFLLTPGNPCLECGIDLSKYWTIDGITHVALPGMKPGYFNGSKPDLGAIQF